MASSLVCKLAQDSVKDFVCLGVVLGLGRARVVPTFLVRTLCFAGVVDPGLQVAQKAM